MARIYRTVSRKSEATVSLGEKIGRRLNRGAVVSLVGALGTGKTTLTKGIARGLGIEEEITSPSFTIMSEYSGTLNLYHIDLYRIDGDLEYLGFDELFTKGGVCVIEWGEKAEDLLPDNPVEVTLRLLPNGSREIIVRGLAL